MSYRFSVHATIDLPRVVVIGSQSSECLDSNTFSSTTCAEVSAGGKSSLVEAVSGVSSVLPMAGSGFSG